VNEMEYDYHKQIEQRFQELRGSPAFLLSVADWNLITQWRSNGIPLACAIRGLELAFRQHEAKRKRHEAVNGLKYCSPQVIEEWQKHRKAVAA